MPTFLCAVQPCNADKHEAKGMCRYHYKRTQPRTPDKPKILPCITCGKLVERYAGGYTRKLGATCSDECRFTLQWGARSELPEDHWARWYGSSSAVFIEPCATCAKLFVGRQPHARNCSDQCRSTYVPVPMMSMACDYCGHTFQSHQRRARYCTQRCAKRVHKQRRRAREHNAEGSFTWTEVTRLWLAFSKACAYCHTPTQLTAIEAEHVRPISKGGRNDLSNLLPSCKACNADKRDLSLTEWSSSRIKRGLPAVTVTWEPSDSRYRHLHFDLAA